MGASQSPSFLSLVKADVAEELEKVDQLLAHQLRDCRQRFVHTVICSGKLFGKGLKNYIC